MDDTLNQILIHACKLARDLETKLPHIANHPPLLFSSCEEVAEAFNKAVHELHSRNAPQYNTQMFFGETSGSLSDMRTASPLDIRAGEGSSHGGTYTPAINFSQGQPMEEDNPFYRRRTPEDQTITPDLRHLGLEIQGSGGGSTPDTHIEAFRRGGGEAPVAADGSSVAERRPTGSSIQRSSRRRSYYRCTHKSYYGCEAKKQVQRLDDDPYTYEIKYCGTHSCNTSTTPLLIPSLAPNDNNNTSSNTSNPQGEAPMPEATAQPPSSLPTSTQLGIWFSRELEHGQRDILSLMDSNTQAGPSNVQGGRDIDSVAALADVMFNSGSSGSSMDAIFSQPRQDN
ncbi:WRKY transcription factor 55-like [Phoenix dactylifera]|uniref:WRKY transcription factor 55 n=1 Tax=Phoenix dactylifera TaxID=42345 RepID=A0A8B9A5Y4_PHODC|nr:WRKY transcription factor 55 [Phoenix dactylifera]XP_038981087.1 WRKY transcription factor 55-like [Phoenix dactylifera]